MADMIYGILASKSCLLTDISDRPHETVQKVNYYKTTFQPSLNRYSCPCSCFYLQTMKRLVPSNLVVLIDESDVAKPEGKQFEFLGIVHDGSESIQTKNVYKKVAM